MAEKLENLVGPWERVVFRSANGRGRVAIESGIVSLFVAPGLALCLALALSNPITSPAGISSVVLLLFFGFFSTLQICETFKFRRRALLLTEQRLLYRHGFWRTRTTDIDLDEITGIVVRGWPAGLGQMTWVERGRRGAVIIKALPHLDRMSHAIAASAPIPLAEQNETAVRRATIVLGAGSAIGGIALGLLPALGLLFFGAGGDISEFCGIFLHYVFFYPAQSASSAVAVAVAGGIGFIVYLWLTVTCFFAGFLLGHYPAWAQVRVFLTPGQAQNTIRSLYPAVPAEGMGKLVRWHYRQTARFLSWLYDTDIRCD